ncbi:uncharacterized protein [Procambarus clarkii]|uniref:uncharacterized protein n=1 Tax=Procambarus clarkii TaxID=6728 RepID=UPI00374377A4
MDSSRAVDITAGQEKASDETAFSPDEKGVACETIPSPEARKQFEENGGPSRTMLSAGLASNTIVRSNLFATSKAKIKMTTMSRNDFLFKAIEESLMPRLPLGSCKMGLVPQITSDILRGNVPHIQRDEAPPVVRRRTTPATCCWCKMFRNRKRNKNDELFESIISYLESDIKPLKRHIREGQIDRARREVLKENF